MTIHLIKLAVGCESIEDLGSWQKQRLKDMKAVGKKPELFHRTYQTPKRREDLLDGGSLYWVIKGIVQVRQQIFDLREGTKDDGTPCCLIMLEKGLVTVRPAPRRPFQGWRYLSVDDAPTDLAAGDADGVAALPPQMRKELAELGLI